MNQCPNCGSIRFTLTETITRDADIIEEGGKIELQVSTIRDNNILCITCRDCQTEVSQYDFSNIEFCD